MDSMWLIGMCGYSIPVLIIPFIVRGSTLIGKSPRVHRFAGWYTFKPIIATPIAILIFSESVDKFFYQDKFLPFGLIFILPGGLLTLLIIWQFRDMYFTESRKVFAVLFALDILRMASMLVSLFGYLNRGLTSSIKSIYMAIFWIAVWLPTFYALVALQ